MKTRTLQVRNSVNRSHARFAFLLIALACFALSPRGQAVDPPPDGGYPNQNTAEGEDALFSLTTGSNNTATGFNALFNNTTGSLNTANGVEALFNNTTSFGNTAVGFQALFNNNSFGSNTAVGVVALFGDTGGYENTAIGYGALFRNTNGVNNTAVGFDALLNNTTGSANTATGYQALYGDPQKFSTGSSNTATGWGALTLNTSGSENTATGRAALLRNTTGFQNTATGRDALFGNTTGGDNTGNGFGALYNNTTGINNTADGANALYSNIIGNNNIALGFDAGFNLTLGSNNIDIGNDGVAGESSTIRIGTVGTQTATYIAGIGDTRLVHGAAVTVGITDDGQLGVRASSVRFKELVKPMDKASEVIFSLQPVTFRYKKDSAAVPQFGLVAEEVAKVNPDLVVPDVEGKPFTVRYEEINAMLLNEFLKEHRTVQELKSLVVKQEAHAAQQQKQIDALTVGLQKVSAQLELSKPAPADGSEQSVKLPSTTNL